MSGARFASLAGAGLLFRMVLTVYFARWLREPLEVVLAWLEAFKAEGTALLVLGVLVHQLIQRRAQRKLAAT